MKTAAGLDAGLLVRRDDELVGAQGAAVPDSFVKVQNQSGSLEKPGVSRPDPRVATPGFQGVLVEDAPDRREADRLDMAFIFDYALDVWNKPATQRLVMPTRQLAGDRFDDRPQARGKKTADDLAAAHLPARNPARSTAGATCGRTVHGRQGGVRPRRCQPSALPPAALPEEHVAPKRTVNCSAEGFLPRVGDLRLRTSDGTSACDRAWFLPLSIHGRPRSAWRPLDVSAEPCDFLYAFLKVPTKRHDRPASLLVRGSQGADAVRTQIRNRHPHPA